MVDRTMVLHLSSTITISVNELMCQCWERHRRPGPRKPRCLWVEVLLFLLFYLCKVSEVRCWVLVSHPVILSDICGHNRLTSTLLRSWQDGECTFAVITERQVHFSVTAERQLQFYGYNRTVNELLRSLQNGKCKFGRTMSALLRSL